MCQTCGGQKWRFWGMVNRPVFTASASRSSPASSQGHRADGRKEGPLPARPKPLPALLALSPSCRRLVVAACGAGRKGDSARRPAARDQTFEGEKQVDSGKLDLSPDRELQATGAAASQLKDPIAIKITGPFQSRGEDKLPEVDFDMTLTAGGQNFTAGAVSTDEKGSITYQGTDTIRNGQFERLRREVERAVAAGQRTSRTSSTCRQPRRQPARAGSRPEEARVRRRSAGPRPCTCPRTCGSARCSRT